ncbi:SURF1 family cytochrome oxidase biogenesis protein [Microbacterium ulmi]|uniref:SURF1-like protein n=1 Tax=Microbacterium ulmi TaxID=179095 RepID=A0A7Y2Q0Q3_9MICO|nr:SURF1 family protein [Microbacterium ulmi]NII70849.1 cytochrome oxidase assembly protein ShyY1 [Microbacterium ulmi]NNH02863.1 SURF1 family protein [Microbacterium ulmi]
MSLRSARPAARWTVYVAVAIVFAVACAFLSNWQFSRNAERSRQLALVAANYDAAPVPLAELLPADGSLAPEDEWHPVTLTGTYLPDQQLLVRNRAHGGTAAFEVLVPFRLDDGRVFLVNRGWVPPGEHQADPDAVPAPPTGEVTVVARLKPGEPLPSSGRSAPDGQVPTIHLPLIADIVGGAGVEAGAYGLMVTEQPAPASAPQALEAPSDDPGPHLSYAIQWILFAVMGFVFIWYVIRSERRARLEDDEDAVETVDGAVGPAASPALGARRRDRDMQDEDALLDRMPR